MKVVIVTLILLASSSRAEPTTFHVTLGLWGGGVWGTAQRRLNNGSYYPVANSDQSLVDLRVSAGWRFRPQHRFSVGAVLDMIPTGGTAMGLEFQVNHPVDDRWRLGLRVSTSTVVGTWSSGSAKSGQLAPGDRFVIMTGLRARYHWASFGVDGVLVRYHRGQTMGVLVGGGVEAEPGPIASLIGATLAIVVAALAATRPSIGSG